MDKHSSHPSSESGHSLRQSLGLSQRKPALSAEAIERKEREDFAFFWISFTAFFIIIMGMTT